MKTRSFLSKRLLILLVPLLSVLVCGLVFLSGDGELAGEKEKPAMASKVAQRTGDAAAENLRGGGNPDKNVADSNGGGAEEKNGVTGGAGLAVSPAPGAAVAAGGTAQIPGQVPVPAPAPAVNAVPVRSWTLQPDAVPVAHWAPGTGGPAPQRSGRLAGGLPGLETAAAGTAVEFPLFDGLTAAGLVRKALETAPGARIWSGPLSHPAGSFFIEHNKSGWRGTLTFKGRPEAYRILPGTAGNEGPWLERWAREEIECSQLNDSSHDPDSPAVDPDLSWNNLQSRPGSSRVIYLKFNGGWVDNTYWNDEYNDDERINFAESGLSGEDRIRAWAHAAEDFRVFGVNVTTVKAAYDAADSDSRVLVVITPTKGWYPNAKGGVGLVGSWGSSGCVVWVWNTSWLSAGDTISHEVGHALGLRHSGYWNIPEADVREYYRGHGEGSNGWAPIMGYGGGEARYLTTWDNGSYPYATSDQNQKAVIAGLLSVLGDDHGDSTATASNLAAQGAGPVFEGGGRLETSSDVDYFRLQMPEGFWVFEAIANPFGKNVNLTMQIRDASNTVINETDVPDSPDVLTTRGTTPGTYYLTVRSTTRADSDADPGYPRYGQIGTYTIAVRPLGYETAPPVAVIRSITGFTLGSTHAEVEVKYTDSPGLDTDTLGNSDVQLGPFGGTLISQSGNSRELYVKYRFDAPGNDWDISEGGGYTVRVPAGAVKDRNGNANVESSVVALLPASDSTPPAATLPNGLGNATEGDTEYRFRVAVADIAPVLVSENGKNCVEVRRVTAGDALFTGLAVTAVREGASSSNYNKNWTMDYSFTPPGGEWDESDIGEYEVRLRAGKVRDVNGNIAPAQKLGSFFLRKKLWERTFDESGPIAVWERDAGWAFGPPQGTGSFRHDPASAYSGNNVLGYRLGSGDAALYEYNLTTPRYATSPAINVSGYSRIFLQFQRWLGVEAGDDVVVQASRNGTSWTTVWRNPGDEGTFDGNWTRQEIEIPAAIADNATGLKFRFGMGKTDGDFRAGGWTIDNIKLIAGGSFNPGRLIVNNVSARVTEGATLNAFYTVRLDQSPISPVTVEIDPGEQLATSRSSIIFTSLNWFTPVNVLLSAVDDRVVEGDRLTGLTHRISSTETDPAFAGVRTGHLVTVVDDESPLIETQPEDKAVAAGQSAVFRVVPVTTALKAYQWYWGNSGDTSNPISGATQALQSITLPAGTTQPLSVWVRVRVNIVGGTREDSETALLSPLKGYAAWKSLLRNHGYNTAALEAAGFDAADPDGDGLGHFMEYAFGGQPYTADQGRLPQVGLERSTGGSLLGLPGSGKLELVLTFGPAKSDVRYVTEISNDLRVWQVFKSVSADGRLLPGRFSPGNTVVRIPTGGDDALFARIRAEYVAP